MFTSYHFVCPWKWTAGRGMQWGRTGLGRGFILKQGLGSPPALNLRHLWGQNNFRDRLTDYVCHARPSANALRMGGPVFISTTTTQATSWAGNSARLRQSTTPKQKKSMKFTSCRGQYNDWCSQAAWSSPSASGQYQKRSTWSACCTYGSSQRLP